MAALMTLLKENWKTLLGGFALGAILGASLAGYAVYLSQEPGRQALVAVAKANEDLGACAVALKEAKDAVDEAAKDREACEKTTAAKTELDKQLAEAKDEIAKLTAALQKPPTRPAEKAPAAKPETKAQIPAYSNTDSKRKASSAYRESRESRKDEQSPRSNWEQGL